MSFLHKTPAPVLMKIKSGYSYGPRTFTKTHGDNYVVPNEVYENDGFEAGLEVLCSKDGEPVFIASSEDSGSGLIIDVDEIVISFALEPWQTDDLDFSCCDFELFIYKGDMDDPIDKLPIAHGEIRVK